MPGPEFLEVRKSQQEEEMLGTDKKSVSFLVNVRDFFGGEGNKL